MSILETTYVFSVCSFLFDVVCLGWFVSLLSFFSKDGFIWPFVARGCVRVQRVLLGCSGLVC